MSIWNPWHGCHKKSAGCFNCYMYRRDAEFGKDSNIVTKTKDYDLGIKRKRDGSYKLNSDEKVYLCMTSDFFIEEADEWIKERLPIFLKLPIKHKEIIHEPLLEEIDIDNYLKSGQIEYTIKTSKTCKY